MNKLLSLEVFKSQLGRRIVLLLLICGIIPLFLFAFPLYYQTHNIMKNEAVDSLKQNLNFANSQLSQTLKLGAQQLVALAEQKGPAPDQTRFFDQIIHLSDPEQIRMGLDLLWSPLNPRSTQRLHQKKVVMTDPFPYKGTTTMALIAPNGSKGYLAGIVHPRQLWEVTNNSYLGHGEVLAILDDQRRLLAASGNFSHEPFKHFSSLMSDTISGNRIESGQAELSKFGDVYWVTRPFWPETNMGTERWNLVVMRRAEAVQMLPYFLLKSLILWLVLALIGLIILAVHLARHFHEPIALLTKATDRLAQGDWSTDVPENSMGEISELAQSFEDMRDELQSSQEQLRHEALHDTLTGLPNRVLLEDRLQQNMEYSRNRPDHSFAILFMDIDRFKFVNDSLGHDVGDELLCSFGERVKECIRSSDTLARIGGDEFVAIMDGISSPQQAKEQARRLNERVSEPFQIQGHDVFAKPSMGIVLYDESVYEEPEELLRDADTAMYRAKELDGSKSYVIFGQTMRQNVQNRLSMETELQHAVRNQDFLVYYQPIMDLTKGQPTGCEVLLRWRHDERGWISPSTFIPLAEETDLIDRIGEWTLRHAVRRFSTWQEENGSMPLEWISINVSAHQLTHMNLVHTLQEVLEDHDLSPSQFKLEVTESALIQGTDFALETLQELHNKGLSICMDDFGTGYSSLAMLHSFPLDMLKIDQQFVRRVHRETNNQAIVQAVTAMAEKLDLTIVAEGIETREELAYICQQTQCNYGQGYLFSHPVNETSFIEYLNGSGPIWPPEALHLASSKAIAQ